MVCFVTIKKVSIMKENLTIYLISGKARHGKTTTANMIKDYMEFLGKKTIVTSFGKYIKMYAKDIIGWDGVSEPKPRTLLQELGTEVIREKLGKNDLFVKRLDDDFDVYNEYVDVVALDDVRLPIEMDYFKERYPSRIKSIHIERTNFDSDLNTKEQAHITEIGLDNYTDYDYTITNDGTLDDLKSKVIKMIGELE